MGILLCNQLHSTISELSFLASSNFQRKCGSVGWLLCCFTTMYADSPPIKCTYNILFYAPNCRRDVSEGIIQVRTKTTLFNHSFSRLIGQRNKLTITHKTAVLQNYDTQQAHIQQNIQIPSVLLYYGYKEVLSQLFLIYTNIHNAINHRFVDSLH